MFCSCSVSRTSEASGSLIFVAASRSDCGKLETGLEGDDQEVDQVGERPLDLLTALARARVDDEAGQRSSRRRRRRTPPSTTSRPLIATGKPEEEPQEGGSDGAEELGSEQPLRGRRVHAGRDQARAVVATLEAVEAADEAAARCRRVISPRRVRMLGPSPAAEPGNAPAKP